MELKPLAVNIIAYVAAYVAGAKVLGVLGYSTWNNPALQILAGLAWLVVSPFVGQGIVVAFGKAGVKVRVRYKDNLQEVNKETA